MLRRACGLRDGSSLVAMTALVYCTGDQACVKYFLGGSPTGLMQSRAGRTPPLGRDQLDRCLRVWQVCKPHLSDGDFWLHLSGMKTALRIRSAQSDDAPAIWGVIGPTIRAGETYALDRDMSEVDALAYWMGQDRTTFVCEENGVILGTYYIRANQAGGGEHICNCGFMTGASATGRGVARAMLSHALDHAREHGFRGMQFNFVVSANTRAVSLWKSFGFEIVGRLPQAFHHPGLGYVDAFVMFRSLEGSLPTGTSSAATR